MAEHQRKQQEDAAQQFAAVLSVADSANQEVIAAVRQGDLATACMAVPKVAVSYEALTNLSPLLAPDARKTVQPGMASLGQQITKMTSVCNEAGL